ncbi:MAG: OmpA family protein [Phycisphaerales bacterium]|nr:OmpA family protein [Phycisphaerales bacterium]
MVKKKKQDGGGGVPEWIVTYGDMMTLLLCFFILLAAFSELKKEDEYQRVVDSIKEAFGYQGGQGQLIIDDPPLRSIIEQLDKLSLDASEHSKTSKSDIEGMEGKDVTVRKIQDGLMFTLGGHLSFAPESAELLESAKDPLRHIADLVRGRTNKIAIRGHAARKNVSADFMYEDLDDLSYYRAKAVCEFLVNECGLDRRVFSLDARGAEEPLAPRRYTAQEQAVNRRAEIILTEVLVEEISKDANFSDPNIARGESAP